MICYFCNTNPSSYTCPRCQYTYCSSVCYKSPKHISCTEEFHKVLVLEQLGEKQSKSDVVKVKNMLMRDREGRVSDCMLLGDCIL